MVQATYINPKSRDGLLPLHHGGDSDGADGGGGSTGVTPTAFHVTSWPMARQD
jgi:hypothetical protein